MSSEAHISAFSIMAHSLHRELLARGIDVPLAACEQILRRVIDDAAAVTYRVELTSQ